MEEWEFQFTGGPIRIHETCRRINLGWRDPATIDIESFADREDEGVLLVRSAGEHLYRLEEELT